MSKRGQQLVEAARRAMHERGSAATTLAVVAAESGVPLGNVYYYFKTRDELVTAVVESRLDELRTFLAAADKKTSPLARLCAVLDAFEARAEVIVRFGCPYGTLAAELEKEVPAARARAGQLFEVQLVWMEAQLRELGAPSPKARAAELLCGLQGACLVAHALHDASLFRRRLSSLARELRTELSSH